MNINNFNQNPIDIIEDVIHSKKWAFSRAANHELVAEITTESCQYRLYFSWSEQIKAINFTVTFDFKIPKSKSKNVYELLARINEKLWIGHFDITSKNGIPAYRYTIFESHENEMFYNQLEDLVDIAIYECEKYYPAFQLLLFDRSCPKEALEFCIIDVLGRA